jgi:hypothetical protein
MTPKKITDVEKRKGTRFGRRRNRTCDMVANSFVCFIGRKGPGSS